MTKQNTHKKIDPSLWGEILCLKDKEAEVGIVLKENMAADEYGLIHGGTVFGMADYAAMVAVNHPNVVLAKAEVKFLKPCKVGEKIVAKAKVSKAEGKKKWVSVEVLRGEDVVFVGEFMCVVPEKHVLEKV